MIQINREKMDQWLPGGRGGHRIFRVKENVMGLHIGDGWNTTVKSTQLDTLEHKLYDI